MGESQGGLQGYDFGSEAGSDLYAGGDLRFL